MSSGCSANRKKIFLVLLTLAALGLFVGGAEALNPNLSNWTLNLSGDETPGETWNDGIQEIEVVGNTVHVTYWSSGASYRLYYRRSTDGGQTWQPKILLYDTNPGGSSSSVDRGWKFLAVDGTSVHVAYAAYHPGYPTCTLMYRRSTDNGASFEDARQLAPDSGGWWWIGPTRIAANAGKVTIAFQFQAVDGSFVTLGSMNSNNGGGNFTYSEVANSGHRYLGVSVDDLKRVGDRVYVIYRQDFDTVWYETWNTALYCAASLDGGANYIKTLMTTKSPVVDRYLTYRTQEASYSPNLALDGDNVYVVWTQNNGSYTSNEVFLYLRRSTDQGLHFGDPITIAQNATDGIGNMRLGMETVAANGGYVYVVFMTEDGTVYLRRSTNSGVSFLARQTMGTGAWWPNMVVDPASGAKVHVFWRYTYRYSADGGASFTNPVVLMPFVANFDGDTGVQMALGPGDTKHFTVPLRFCTTAYGWGDRDIFYRSLGPVPAPSSRNQAFKTFSDGAEARYDCMEVASTGYLNFASQMSAEVWVKPQAGGVNTGFTNDHKLILHKLTDAVVPGGNRLYSLGTYTFGTPDDPRRRAIAELSTTIDWYTLSPEAWDPIGLVPDNAWTHLAFTYDAGAGENNFKLYKNGQLIASRTATGNVTTGNGNFFAGYYGRWEMQEMRLWSRALSQAEIQANLNRKLTGTEANLNAYWQFSDTTKDQTGHGNDGILIYQESFVPSTRGAAALPAVNSLLLSD
jgi:hypothetical protein